MRISQLTIEALKPEPMVGQSILLCTAHPIELNLISAKAMGHKSFFDEQRKQVYSQVSDRNDHVVWNPACLLKDAYHILEGSRELFVEREWTSVGARYCLYKNKRHEEGEFDPVHITELSESSRNDHARCVTILSIIGLLLTAED